MKKLLPIVILVAAAIGVAGSCKQEDGERCQVPSDCRSGMCNVAEHLCVSSGSGGAIDAFPPEGGLIDAPVDTPPVDAIDAPLQ